MRSTMGLPITAGCDTAQDLTRVCSDTSSTEMQCLRPLRQSGALLASPVVIFTEAGLIRPDRVSQDHPVDSENSGQLCPLRFPHKCPQYVPTVQKTVKQSRG